VKRPSSNQRARDPGGHDHTFQVGVSGVLPLGFHDPRPVSGVCRIVVAIAGMASVARAGPRHDSEPRHRCREGGRCLTVLLGRSGSIFEAPRELDGFAAGGVGGLSYFFFRSLVFFGRRKGLKFSVCALRGAIDGALRQRHRPGPGRSAASTRRQSTANYPIGLSLTIPSNLRHPSGANIPTGTLVLDAGQLADTDIPTTSIATRLRVLLLHYLFAVHEKNSAAFVQADFRRQLGGERGCTLRAYSGRRHQLHAGG